MTRWRSNRFFDYIKKRERETVKWECI